MRDLPHPVSIKTSPPSLVGVIERERLTKALADLPAPAKWLQSLSGTGKSTLAASYARRRGKPLVWYRLDERDNDPAFFYDEFEQALRAQAQVTEPLPRFSGDDHDRQQQFAQRFFDALAAELAERAATIVLDDVQRLTSPAMQSALAVLIAVTAKESELVFVSQASAPTAFFDAIAGRQLVMLNDADLHFNAEECKSMTAALRFDGAQSDSIAVLTGGHAGALVLACELLRGTDPNSALVSTTVERIHLHLLSKLVERMPEARRKLLMQTAFVAQLTRPVVAELAGPEAAQELDALVESGLLHRVGTGPNEIFEAHGLVRQGIQTFVRSHVGEAHAHELAERTASVLAANDQAEAAFGLLVEIGLLQRATDQLADLSERYAARGQVDLLFTLLEKLPAAEVRCNPWLCFWTGQALLRVDEERAREWLGYSYSSFQVLGQLSGMRLAGATIVTAFALECGDFRELDLWIERHKLAHGDTPVPTNDRFEAALLMGVICAAFVTGAYPTEVNPDSLVARMRVLLDQGDPWLSTDQRVQAARTLIEHGMVFSSFSLAQSTVLSTRHIVDRAEGGALHRGRWHIAAAYAYFQRADTAQCLAHFEEAQAVAEQLNSNRLSFELGFARADYWMKSHNIEQATDELDRLHVIAESAPPAQRAQYARMRGRLLLLQQQPVEGLRWAQEARQMAVPAGYTNANLRVFDFDVINALAANDRITEALEIVNQQNFEPREIRVAVENCLRFLQAPESNIGLLRVGLGAARQCGFTNLLERAPAPLARLCDAALTSDIETDFVRHLILAKKLDPPPSAGSRWPWQVHVRTLGGFRLDIDGKRYSPSHKAQDKPLELLKLLVTCEALGRRSAEKSWVAERLWPDADSDNARKSLDMTVARLRRLLSSDGAVLSIEGKLELSTALVWTDIRPLLNALSRTRVRRDEYIAGKHSIIGEAATIMAELLEHYSGPYLDGEDGPPWLLAGREAIASAVRHALVTADAMLSGTADELLIPATERAFAADPSSEDLARALMKAYLRRGQHSEALRVYRRLREMLSLLLGVAPSSESERIRDLAYAADLKGAELANPVVSSRP